MTWIKICGVTNVDDAEHVVRSGANAIGLNFVHGSKRRVTYEQARPIIEAVRGRIELVAVVANPTDAEVKELREELGIEWLQLHGDEPAARLTRLLPRAFKACAIEDAADARRAAGFPGERLLVAEIDAQLTVEPDGGDVGVFLRACSGRSSSRLLFNAGKLPGLRRYLVCHRYEPYWMKPAVGTRLREVPAETQFLLGELVAGGWLL